MGTLFKTGPTATSNGNTLKLDQLATSSWNTLKLDQTTDWEHYLTPNYRLPQMGTLFKTGPTI